MILRNRLVLFVLSSLLFFIPSILASEATSFCKCTCFSNSTIIQLGPPANKDGKVGSSSPNDGSGISVIDSRDVHDADAIFLRPRTGSDGTDGNGGSSDNPKDGDKNFRSLTCNDCTRKLCLEYQLPKCKDATEEDVFTTCFQRDSTKDQAVVFIFIIATAGLLLWALLKPWIERWMRVARERRSYLPVATQEDER